MMHNQVGQNFWDRNLMGQKHLLEISGKHIVDQGSVSPFWLLWNPKILRFQDLGNFLVGCTFNTLKISFHSEIHKILGQKNQ